MAVSSIDFCRGFIIPYKKKTSRTKNRQWTNVFYEISGGRGWTRNPLWVRLWYFYLFSIAYVEFIFEGGFRKYFVQISFSPIKYFRFVCIVFFFGKGLNCRTLVSSSPCMLYFHKQNCAITINTKWKST